MLADPCACARQVSNEVGFVKKARSAWREELGLLESRLADLARTAEQQAADKETKLTALSTTLDGFKSEARAAFEGVRFSHNRLRELIDDRYASSGGAAGAADSGSGTLGGNGAAGVGNASSLGGAHGGAQVRFDLGSREHAPAFLATPGGIGAWSAARATGGEGGAAAALGIAATPSRPFRLNGFGTPSPTAASARLALHQPSTGTRNEPRRTSPA
jgi:hypothetical protein